MSYVGAIPPPLFPLLKNLYIDTRGSLLAKAAAFVTLSPVLIMVCDTWVLTSDAPLSYFLARLRRDDYYDTGADVN
jgi:hypothetical protein